MDRRESPLPRISRRRCVAALALAAGALAACGGRREQLPAPEGTAAPAAPGGLGLEEFLTLSAVLTGFPRERLSPELGRIYLESLQARPDGQVRLADLYAQAGFRSSAPPASVEQLAATGLFDREPPRALADAIVVCWYTGLYERGGRPAVATFADALAWQALGYAAAPGSCQGAVGSWAEAPGR